MAEIIVGVALAFGAVTAVITGLNLYSSYQRASARRKRGQPRRIIDI
jgi:hypothetical protein